ncbi:MAG: MATE family efflux transporter [Clostridia bacterium]|nr:MATE family efflux transporter [Clostridia bacterium]
MIAFKRLHFGKKQEVDMTQGSIFRHLLMFALPLLIGNVFQQFYNMVDTWVVGNYVSNEAFSAVGSVGPIINTLIGFFMGLSSGAGAVISQYFGAKREDKVRNTVHTAIVMTFVLGIVFTVIGNLMTPMMLRLMKTPEEVLPQSTAYLRIYFSGILGLMVYNMGAGILRAVGDSRRPFYFLVVSAVINIVLDLVFVLGFGMGVEGVAYATIIAQNVSAILVLVVLFRSNNCVRIQFSRLRVHWDMLSKIILVGIPAGIQMMLTSFSNVFVQSYINFFGPDCMSGWTAYSKVDHLLLLPMQSVALASTTFVAQNLGSGQEARARRGIRTAIVMAIGSTVILLIPVLLFAPYLVTFFNDKPEVVEYGTRFLRSISYFYVFCCINQILAGALRGSGKSRAAMLIMLTSFVFFRQAYLYVVANYVSNTVSYISMAYPAGWMLASALLLIYYRFTKLSKNDILKEKHNGKQEVISSHQAQ